MTNNPILSCTCCANRTTKNQAKKNLWNCWYCGNPLTCRAEKLKQLIQEAKTFGLILHTTKFTKT